MKLKLWKWIAAIAVLTAVMPAQAQMWHRQRAQSAAEEQRAPEGPRMREAPVQIDGQRQEFQQPGRMSPEERRQLRRDIHEAGRELYRRRGERSSE